MRASWLQLPTSERQQVLQPLLREHVQSTIRHLQVWACGVCCWGSGGCSAIIPCIEPTSSSNSCGVVKARFNRAKSRPYTLSGNCLTSFPAHHSQCRFGVLSRNPVCFQLLIKLSRFRGVLHITRNRGARSCGTGPELEKWQAPAIHQLLWLRWPERHPREPTSATSGFSAWLRLAGDRHRSF